MPKCFVRIAYIIVWSIVLVSCSSVATVSDCPNIILKKSDKVGKLDLSDLSDTYTVFKPETTDESMISNILRIWRYKSCVYVLDNRNQILVFDESGKYLWKLNNRGTGPGEYTHLMDFAIDQKHDNILLLDYGRIIRYDLTGKYLDFIKSGDGVEISTDGRYAYMKCFDEENGKANRYSLKIIDLDTSTVTDALPVTDDWAPSCSPGFQTLTFSDGRVLFSRKFDSRIYFLYDKNASATYDIDWGTYTFQNISGEKYDCSEFFRLCRENEFIYSMGDMILSHSLCLFKTNLNLYGLIYRADDTIKLANNLTDTRLFPKSSPPFKSISVNGDTPEIAIVFNSVNSNFFATRCADPKIASVLSGMRDEDNPLLLLYTLKNDVKKL